MAYNPALPFVSGVYPNQVIPSSNINTLLTNIANSRKPVTDASNIVTSYAAPNAITQATAGTWQNLTDGGVTYSIGEVFGYMDTNQDMLIHFEGQVVASATVANNALFSVFVNNTIVGGVVHKLKAYNTVGTLVSFYKLVPAASFNTALIKVMWQVELGAPNVTFTIPNGFRVMGIQI